MTTSVEQMILDQLAELKQAVESCSLKLDALTGQQAPSPAIKSSATMLIELARINPRAAIEEAKRLSKADSLRRREEKKAAKK